MIQTDLSLAPGKNAQPPNTIVVSLGAKKVAVTVDCTMSSDETTVVGTARPERRVRWCVLDRDLRQVAAGAVGAKMRSKKAMAYTTRLLHGGGAVNPDKLDVELPAAKLKNGQPYTLVVSNHGSLSALDFVAVHEPKPKPEKKPARRKTAKKKAAKKPVRKAAAKKAVAKKPAAKKAAAKKPAAKKAAVRKRRTTKKSA